MDKYITILRMFGLKKWGKPEKTQKLISFFFCLDQDQEIPWLQ